MDIDFTSYLLNLQSFLRPWQRVYNHEVLQSYPQHLEFFPMDWITWARALSNEELFLWESKGIIPAKAPENLNKFFKQTRDLQNLVPQIPSLPNLIDSHGFLKIKEKKRHEIERLVPYLALWAQDNKIEQVVDVGSGIGLLSHCLAKYYHLPVLSLDQDESLQEKGRQRQKRHLFNGVTYHLLKLSKNFSLGSKLANFPRVKGSLCVGLHTCGDLGLAQLQLAQQLDSSIVVHFGCCYHKLGPSFLLSQKAQNSDLEFSNQALTLAAKSYQRFDFSDFEFKLKVKTYRYLFHLWLCHELKQEQFVSLGPSHHKLYEKTFYQYASVQIKRLNYSQPSEYNLTKFSLDKDNLSTVRDMILVGILRGELGRIIELLILCDRALYLKEQGYEVELGQYFDRSISPRNIGLVGKKKSNQN